MTYLTTLAALAFYASGWAHLWQHRQQTSPPRLWLILAGLACHLIAAHSHLFGDAVMQLSLIYVVNVLTLVITAVVGLASLRLRVHQLLVLIVPLDIIALSAALIFEPGPGDVALIDGTLLAHILISLAAYSVLMLAACQSILLAVLERQLRNPQQSQAPWLGPLDSMEQLLVTLLWIGLALLTLSIGSGFLFLEDVMAQNVAHHIVITSLSWLVYAFFLAGRYFFGWRGLTAVRWTLVAFALLVIGYLGSKFVLEYLIPQ